MIVPGLHLGGGMAEEIVVLICFVYHHIASYIFIRQTALQNFVYVKFASLICWGSQYATQQELLNRWSDILFKSQFNCATLSFSYERLKHQFYLVERVPKCFLCLFKNTEVNCTEIGVGSNLTCMTGTPSFSLAKILWQSSVSDLPL